MLLKTLRMKNFRQYKGEQMLTFSTDNDKNVTVVLGKNTSGKTTLIQAFNWALYGKANFDTADFMLNLEIADDLESNESEKVEVSIELVHDGIEYTMIRSQNYICKSPGNIDPQNAKALLQYKTPDGQTGFIENYFDIRDTINKILPEDLSTYFFFDGERITNLGKNSLEGRKDITKAVKGVLGLTALDNAITHLKRGHKHSVIARFINSIHVEGDEKLKQLKSEAIKCREDLDLILKRLEDNKAAISFFKKKYEELAQVLRDNEKTAKLQQKIEGNEASIRVYENKKAEEASKIIKEFSNKGSQFFMQPLISKAKEILDKEEYTDKGIPHIQSSTIDHILKRGKCICGETIQNGDNKYIALSELKKYLPPEAIGVVVKNFLNDAKHYKRYGSEFLEGIEEYYKNFRQYKHDISTLMSENKHLSEQIKEKKDVKKVKQESDNYEEKIEDLRRESEELHIQKGKLTAELESKTNEIAEQSIKTKRNRHIEICLQYAKYIADELEKYYKTEEDKIRRLLQERVDSIFEKMYHGERKLVIAPNYKYFLMTPGIKEEFQDKADKSMGLETVTSFAFISGILALAREKVLDEEFGMESEPYPLVMDAPFSNADEEHVEKISDILPRIAEQVIMFIMHKDWEHAEGVLSSKLDKKYELDKKTETYTIIREC
ncbi:MAG TPA: AAA family ATPase [Thermoanaerobacterales bacterium]|nr:AAA family ATPase [Thermoanaerobacterales bacterium]